MKPGIYAGMKRAEYESIEAINQSTLKLFRRSAAHAREYMLHPPAQTEAMMIGTAVHCAVLEPTKFSGTYVVAPRVDRRTKAGKETWANFESENRGKELLDADDFEMCSEICRAIHANTVIGRMLESPGKNEVGIVWQDEKTGLLCKALLDRITTYAGWTCVMDLKTCEDARPGAFGRDCYTYGYYLQAPFYLAGLNALAPLNRRFIFAVAEKSRPYATAVYELDQETMKQGEREMRHYLDTYAHCKKTGNWPGYPDDLQTVSIPRWAQNEE